MGLAEDVAACLAGDNAACVRAAGGSSGADDADDAPSSRSVIGQVLYDPSTREPLGVLTQNNDGELFLRRTTGPANQHFTVRFRPGAYMLGNGQVVAVGNTGFYVGSAVTPPAQATGGGGSGITFGQQQALTEQDFQNQLRFLEAQEKAARERFDYESAANFQNQIELLKLNQEFATGERIGSQEFTAAENELSRENSLRLQKLQEAGSLRRQVLDLQARGRELKASLIGKDPFRSAALAQGLTPTRGTPADLLGGELDALIRRPVPQPASMSISDINTTLEELTQTAGAGLPSTGGFGIPALADGGVINMREDENGVFSPTVLGNSATRNPPTIRSAAHGGTFKRPGRKNGKAGAGDRSAVRPSEAMQVLVGEKGPELLSISPNEIQVTPVVTAADGRRIQWPALGAGIGAPGQRQPTSSIISSAPTRPSGIAPRPTIPDRTPTLLAPGDISFPGIPPSFPPAPVPEPTSPTSTGPDFEPSPVAITQALASVYSRLGFDRIPTFSEGPFGGMEIPTGGLAALDPLGFSPSLIRVLGDDDSRGYNFWVSPSGQLQRFRGGGRGQQGQQQGLLGSGFRIEDFLAVNLEDFADRFGIEQFLGAPEFEGQDILRDVSPTAFPLRRSPIGVDFGDIWRQANPDLDPSLSPYGPGGIFAPSPRTLASIYRTSDAATQAVLLSLWTQDFFTEDQVFDELSFFSPRGNFSPSQVAGFG